MTAPRVIVVGGGLAGLQAAVACADAGARVTLFESRPRLGGATWSIERDGLHVDNGQHVFLRCCTAYRAFLERLGVSDRVFLQERLAVPVAAPGRPLAWIRSARLPAPAHLAASLLRYPHLDLRQRLRAARVARAFTGLDPADPRLDGIALGDWLREQGESGAAMDRLWDLLIRPTLNLPVREASLALAVKVLRTGFLDRADAGDIGWSEVPLAKLHAEPAAALLEGAGARVELRARVDAIEAPRADGPAAVVVGGRRIEADAVIVAAPAEAAARLLPDEAGLSRAALGSLGHTPILNLHVVVDRPVMDTAFVAGIDTPVQWVFDRTASSGLDRGQYLAVSLSAADEWIGRPLAELRGIFEPALRALFPAMRRAEVQRFFAIAEPRATFRQAPGCGRLRPRAETQARGICVAGAWTDTTWPATMEGAVRSGLSAARAALIAAGRTRSLPEEAAA